MGWNPLIELGLAVQRNGATSGLDFNVVDGSKISTNYNLDIGELFHGLDMEL